MSDRSKIEWCDTTWNVITGCTKVSQGCKNCYAERIAGRFWGERKFTDVQVHPERLEDPLHWKKPRRVFVNSMSDLFHEDVPFEFIQTVWHVMAATDQHTYMILTKRPDRMLHFTQWMVGYDDISIAEWPRNVWLGVSVEDQKAAYERIPLLLQTPAAVRFVSCEPLLGPVQLDVPHSQGIGDLLIDNLDWVIAGGESGPGARPMHPDWARSLRDQCQAAGVPFFFKQWGEWETISQLRWPAEEYRIHVHNWGDGNWSIRVGKKDAGRLLDGREWNEYPEDRR